MSSSSLSSGSSTPSTTRRRRSNSSSESASTTALPRDTLLGRVVAAELRGAGPPFTVAAPSVAFSAALSLLALLFPLRPPRPLPRPLLARAGLAAAAARALDAVASAAAGALSEAAMEPARDLDVEGESERAASSRGIFWRTGRDGGWSPSAASSLSPWGRFSPPTRSAKTPCCVDADSDSWTSSAPSSRARFREPPRSTGLPTGADVLSSRLRSSGSVTSLHLSACTASSRTSASVTSLLASISTAAEAEVVLRPSATSVIDAASCGDLEL
mmetsp:Transcript_23041/g.70532  ORF Transcript_23041/g.70532 Transcript_23041/m.70532 type:complete len:272 (-) Transcript_23041:2788-3603(-)